MTEINLDIGERPELRWVDVELIDVDHNYQREVDGRRVENILKDFRWDHFGAVVLAPKPDGRYAVTDGQHRCKAAKLHPYITSVPALVTSLRGTEEEAENFLVINRRRKTVTPVETFWAGIAASDPMASRIREVLLKADCDVAASSAEYRPGHTNAVAALERTLSRYGDTATTSALRVIRDAWPKDAKALRGTLIAALARLIKNNSGLDLSRLVKVLVPKNFAEITAAAEGFRRLSGGSAETVISKAVAELYNKGLGSANQIYFGEGR